jgi:transposase
VFWPDLASSHYSKKALEYLSDKNIEVVPKCYNPANCPELRPIEDFWSELKRIVYDKCWVADNLEQLRNRIEYALTKVTPECVQSLAGSTFRRIDATQRGNMLES